MQRKSLALTALAVLSAVSLVTSVDATRPAALAGQSAAPATPENPDRQPVASDPLVSESPSSASGGGAVDAGQVGQAFASGDAWPSDLGMTPSDGFLEIRRWCKDREVTDNECSFTYFEDMTLNGAGREEATRIIEELNSLDPLFQPVCHHAYHGVGQSLPYLMPVRDALLSVPDVACQGGMVHGVVQTWSRQVDSETVRTEGPSLCAIFPEMSIVGAFCGHGVGHAIGVHFPESIVAAAEICATAPSSHHANNCIDGLVMEFGGTDFVTKSISGELGKPRAVDMLDEQEALEVCNVIAESMRERCALKVFQLWPDVWSDPAAHAARCALMATTTQQQNCAYSIGEIGLSRHPFIKYVSPQDEIVAAISECGPVPDDMVDACVSGVVSVIWRDVPLDDTRVDTLCKDLPKRFVAGCALGEQLAIEYRGNT